MVTLVKYEHHQVNSQFAYELDLDKLQEIYPDLDEQELADRLAEIESGDFYIEQLIEDAYENDVDIEWDRQYDDWWTDRKGGYEITYELGDQDSWYEQPAAPEPTHKCTKCRWKGSKYETATVFLNEDGSVHQDTDTGPQHTKDVCPMCDSDVELTEEGKQAEEKMKRLIEELDNIEIDDE